MILMNDINKSFFLAFNEKTFPKSTAQEKQYNKHGAVYLTENARKSKQIITEAIYYVIKTKRWTIEDSIQKDIPVLLKTEWYFPIPKSRKGKGKGKEKQSEKEKAKEYENGNGKENQKIKEDTKNGMIYDGQWKVSKPDTDNLVKGLKDIMTDSGVFWHDDAQVCAEIITKRYADVPGIYITVCPVDNANDFYNF